MANLILSDDLHAENSPKRPRRTYDDFELNQLETVFALNSYPDRQHRNNLAREMGVSPKNIQIWFQNRRARARTLRRKAEGVVENPIERMRLQWSSTMALHGTSKAWSSETTNDENLAPPSCDGQPSSSSSSAANNIKDDVERFHHHRFSVSNLSDISNSSFGDTLESIDEDLFAETFMTLFSPGFQSQINFDF